MVGFTQSVDNDVLVCDSLLADCVLRVQASKVRHESIKDMAMGVGLLSKLLDDRAYTR